jgi:hypothetical protein
MRLRLLRSVPLGQRLLAALLALVMMSISLAILCVVEPR